MNCEKCVHEKICGLWRAAESQDASCYDETCFEEKGEARCEILERMVKEYQDVIVPGYREQAQAAEARVHELETAYRLEKCEDGPECAELGKARRALEAAEARAEKAESERDEYFKHLQGLCFCCAHRTDGFDCHVKCYGHKRGSAWVYAGPREEK